MRYTDVAKLMTKKASGLGILTTIMAPELAPVAIGAATNPATAIPAAAVGGLATGVGLYNQAVGKDLNAAVERHRQAVNENAAAFRQAYTKRQQKAPQMTPKPKTDKK